jgi:hypothetical protein
LLFKIEFGKIVLNKIILEHRLFIKKDKLAHGTILLNVVDFMLHHLAHAKIAKIHGINFVQHLKKYMLVTNCNYVKSSTILDGGRHFNANSY